MKLPPVPPPSGAGDWIEIAHNQSDTVQLRARLRITSHFREPMHLLWTFYTLMHPAWPHIRQAHVESPFPKEGTITLRHCSLSL
jgi:hypothetical protein